MIIQPGDKIPESMLYEMGDNGPEGYSTEELFAGKTVVLFGLPGAYTPTCSAKHVPSYVENAEKLREKGVDEVICMAVNDAFVMGAWGKDQGVDDKVRMLADGSAEFTKKLGLELDLTERGMGVRCDRFAMIVKDGVVQSIDLEAPGEFKVSDAETQLGKL